MSSAQSKRGDVMEACRTRAEPWTIKVCPGCGEHVHSHACRNCGKWADDVRVVPAAAHQGAVERAEKAERARDEYREGWLRRGRELNELYDRIANLHSAAGGR